MTQALKEVATRCDGVVCSMAMLVLDDVFRSTWAGRSIAPTVDEEASPFGEFWWHATRSVHEVYPDFLLIGEAYWGHEWRLQQLGFDYTYDASLLERFVAGDVASRDRSPARRRRLPASLRAPARGPQSAAHRRPAGRPPGARRGRRRGDRARGCSSSATARSRAPAPTSRSSSGASPTRSRTPGCASFYCRVLRATDDEAFRLGHAIRLEPTPAWPGNATHEAHRRPAVGRPAPPAPAGRRQPGRRTGPGVHPPGTPRVRRQDRPPRRSARRRELRTPRRRPARARPVRRPAAVRPPPVPGHPPDDAVRRAPPLGRPLTDGAAATRRARPARGRRPGSGSAGCG